jgi:hypothetical protein
VSLDDIVNATISRETATLSLQGFGTPLVLAPEAEAAVVSPAFSERLRYYTKLSALAAEGWSTTGETYLEAQAIFSQQPRPPRIAIGRRAAAVAQVITITPTAANAQAYEITQIFDGDAVYGPFQYTSDADATVNEIVAAFIALINATLIKVTASGTTTLILTADVAGVPFTVTETDTRLAPVTTTPSTGIPEDLAAIEAEQSDWYGLILTVHDAGNIIAAAATVEAMATPKLLIAQSAQAAITSATYNSGTPYTDVASTLKSRSYARSSVWYHATATERLAAAIMGQVLPKIAGSTTWKFRQLAGVTTQSLSATQRANLLSKNANSYESNAGRGMTFEGKVAEGEYIDVIHGIDRLHSRIQENVVLALVKNDKIDFTQQGIQTIASGVYSALEEAASPAVRLIASSRVNAAGDTVSPAFTVTPPAIEDIAASDRAARTIPASDPIVFEATLAGAIHIVNITGSVSV